MIPPRVKFLLIGLFALAVAALAGTWFAAYESAGKLERDPSFGFEGAIRPPGSHVPDFALRDQDGEVVRGRDLRGRGPAIVTFIYATCDDTCPIQVQQIRGALDEIGAEEVPVVGISVDPANDTPSRARAFLLEQHMTGRMDFLLGSRRELEPVWREFGVAPQQEDLDHSAHVVVIDGRGRQRVGFPHSQLTIERLAHDLRKLGAAG